MTLTLYEGDISDPNTWTTNYDFYAYENLGSVVIEVSSVWLDYETTPSYSLILEATDMENIATLAVTINVTDVAEAPVLTATETTFSIPEDAQTYDVVNSTDITVSDPQGDWVTLTLYEGDISDPNTWTTNYNFYAYENLGSVVIEVSSGWLDYETTPSYSLILEATDMENIATLAVTINVPDVTETTGDPNATPIFDVQTDYFYVPSDTPDGTEITTITASDTDGDTLTYSLTANPLGYFSIDSSSGIVSVNGSIVFGSIPEIMGSEGVYIRPVTLTVQVKDPSDDSATMDFVMEVQDSGPGGTTPLGSGSISPSGYTGTPGDAFAALAGNVVFQGITTALSANHANWVPFLDWSLDQGYTVILTDLADGIPNHYVVDFNSAVIKLDSWDALVGVFGDSRPDTQIAAGLRYALEEILEHHWGYIPTVANVADSMPVTYQVLIILDKLRLGASDHWGSMTNIFGSQNRCYKYADAMHSAYGMSNASSPAYTVNNVIYNEWDGGVFITDEVNGGYL